MLTHKPVGHHCRRWRNNGGTPIQFEIPMRVLEFGALLCRAAWVCSGFHKVVGNNVTAASSPTCQRDNLLWWPIEFPTLHHQQDRLPNPLLPGRGLFWFHALLITEVWLYFSTLLPKKNPPAIFTGFLSCLLGLYLISVTSVPWVSI